MRLFTRNGHDWSGRFPLITEAALRNRNSSFLIDGEGVLLGVDGRSDFDGLHSRKHDDEVQFYAFDMLVSASDDLRKLPLSMRKANLAWLLARRVDGIFLSDFEQGEIGPDLFRHACLLGLEGLVSKLRDRPDRTGRSPRWIKVENRQHPAMHRVMESFSLMTVLIYVDTSKQVGGKDHLKIFANEDAMEKWFAENDPEGVAFAYEVLESPR